MEHYEPGAYEDKLLTCVDCGKDFVFEAGEQLFFFTKNPPLAPPKRCPACRARRKATIKPPTDLAGVLRRVHALFPNDPGGHRG